MTDLELIRELREQARIYLQAADMLSGHTKKAETAKKRQLSAAARQRISLAQQKRWAVVNGGKKKAA